MKRNWFNLVCIILSMLLIGANLAAYCGYWYNDGNALALLAAVLLLISIWDGDLRTQQTSEHSKHSN